MFEVEGGAEKELGAIDQQEKKTNSV